MLKLCQQKLEELRPKLGTDNVGHPASYGLLKQDKSFKLYLDKICLQDLRFSPTQGKNQSVFHFQQAPNTTKVNAYLDYILGGLSPWKQLLKTQQPQDFDFILRNGYVVTDVNHPANLVANFLMAFRMPYEKPNVVELWYNILQDGVRPGTSMAVLFGTLTDQSLNSNGVYNLVPGVGHSPIMMIDDSGNFTGSSIVTRLNTQSVVTNNLSKHTFRDSTVYSPCNTIWIQDGKLPLFKRLRDFIQSSGKTTKLNRIFPEPIKRYSPANTYQASYETLRDFCLQLDKETNE